MIKKKSTASQKKTIQSPKKKASPKKSEEKGKSKIKRGALQPPKARKQLGNGKKRISIRKTSESSESVSSEYVSIIKKNLSTPIATLNFCAIFKPHYFSGSPIPRYKVSILLDPKNREHKKYLERLEGFAVQNEVPTIGRMTEEGYILMSYQGRDKPSIFLVEENEGEPEEIELDHDLPKGFKCKVYFDLKRYYDKFGQKNAFTYTPTKVIFYLDEETQQIVEVNNGNSEGDGD